MKAVRGTGDPLTWVKVDEVPEAPGVGELVDVKSASICRSDLTYVGYGARGILGHEVAGVRANGSAVVVEAIYGCGACAQCLQGRHNRCPTHSERALGLAVDGGMADQFRAPAERLIALPSGLDARDASIVEPAAVSWHALRLAQVGPNTWVAVVGAGGLGLLAVAGAFRQGVEAVAVEARHPFQQEAGERLGATIGTDGRYDVVIEAAGTAQSLARCADLVAPGGKIVVLGLHTDATISIPWLQLFMREASVIPTIGYCAHANGREMDDAAAMLADDPSIIDTVVTHRFALQDAVEAFRVAADKRSGAIRVVLQP